MGLSDNKLSDKPIYILGKVLTGIFCREVDGSALILIPTKSFNGAIIFLVGYGIGSLSLQEIIRMFTQEVEQDEQERAYLD
jgi:hypothetical protein